MVGANRVKEGRQLAKERSRDTVSRFKRKSKVEADKHKRRALASQDIIRDKAERASARKRMQDNVSRERMRSISRGITSVAGSVVKRAVKKLVR